MSVVSLLGVNVLNNPAKATDKYQFEITFECLESLTKGDFPFPEEWSIHSQVRFADDCLSFRARP